jgi:hypothetical protein
MACQHDAKRETVHPPGFLGRQVQWIGWRTSAMRLEVLVSKAVSDNPGYSADQVLPQCSNFQPQER